MSEQGNLDIDVTAGAIIRAAPPTIFWAVAAWHAADQRWKLYPTIYRTRYDCANEARRLPACWTEYRLLKVRT